MLPPPSRRRAGDASSGRRNPSDERLHLQGILRCSVGPVTAERRGVDRLQSVADCRRIHPRVWVGLDVGTQSARAMVVAADGRWWGAVRRRCAACATAGATSRTRRAWWEAVAAASREALRGVAPERVRGVATCATSGTILLVDRAGEPLTPGLMYDDARARRAGGAASARERALRRGARSLAAVVGAAEAALDARRVAASSRAGARRRPPGRRRHARARRRGRAVGLEPRAEDRLRPGARGVAARRARRCVPSALLPEVVRSGSRLGEVCARGGGGDRDPRGHARDRRHDRRLRGAVRRRRARRGRLELRARHDARAQGLLRAPIVRDPGGVLYCHRAPDGGWLPGGASSTGAGVLSAALRRPRPRRARPPRRGVRGHGRARLPARLARRALPVRGAGRRARSSLGEPRDEAELFAALLQGVAFAERLCFDYVDLLGAPTGGELTLTGGATRSRVLVPAARRRARPAGAARRAARGRVRHGDPRGVAQDATLAEVAAGMVRTREVIEPRARPRRAVHRALPAARRGARAPRLARRRSRISASYAAVAETSPRRVARRET